MTMLLFGLILTSVSCSAIAQLLLKTGMSQPEVVSSLNAGGSAIALAVATNVWIISGLGLYFFGAVVWLFVLARVEVSFAYPFVGLGFVLTLVLGKLVMGDAVTLSRMIGTLFVALGVILIAKQ
jgi:multidrug transporter EmrE-like cation transporter